MKKTKRTYIKNKDILSRNLKTILKEIYQNENPEEITEYKKFFKKHVNIFARTYVGAYLIKKYIASRENDYKDNKNKFIQSNKIRDKRPQQNRKSTHLTPPPHLQKNSNNRNEQSPEGTTQYPRNQRISLPIGRDDTTKEELTHFLISNGIEKSSIAQIKILHKNSLVYVQSHKTSQFIKDINGKKYKNTLIRLKSHSPHRK